MKEFLLLGISKDEVEKSIESTQLFLSLKFLKCPFMEKRLKGISELKYIIDKVEYNDDKKYKKYGNNMDVDYRVTKGSKWMTAEYLAEWLTQHGVMEYIIGD